MIVEAKYGELRSFEVEEAKDGYAFHAPDGSRIGDVLVDAGDRLLTVVKLGTEYQGKLKSLYRPLRPRNVLGLPKDTVAKSRRLRRSWVEKS